MLIEDQIKARCALLSNCVLIGDKRKFLSMLVTLRVVVNPDTLEPTKDIDANGLIALKAIGSTAKTVEEAKADPLVFAAIEARVADVLLLLCCCC